MVEKAEKDFFGNMSGKGILEFFGKRHEYVIVLFDFYDSGRRKVLGIISRKTDFGVTVLCNTL